MYTEDLIREVCGRYIDGDRVADIAEDNALDQDEVYAILKKSQKVIDEIQNANAEQPPKLAAKKADGSHSTGATAGASRMARALERIAAALEQIAAGGTEHDTGE